MRWEAHRILDCIVPKGNTTHPTCHPFREGGEGGHDVRFCNNPQLMPGLPHTIEMPPFCRAGSPPLGGGGGHKVTVPSLRGGGGTAPQICTIASQCKSALAPSAPSISCAFWAKVTVPPAGGGFQGG